MAEPQSTAVRTPDKPIQLSSDQERALEQIEAWFRRGAPQVFRLFGYAGTGKTTITQHAVTALGLDNAEVAYAAYTGKAAQVMTRRGTPATTIHQLCRKLRGRDENLIERLQRDVDRLEQTAASWQTVEAAKRRLRDACDPVFGRDLRGRGHRVALFVIDEVSMVDAELGRDLQAFGKPILVIGDPGQLPPIDGAGYFVDTEPDVMLTDIHRQACDSPIIRLATMARRGERIPFGNYGPGVSKRGEHLRRMVRRSYLP